MSAHWDAFRFSEKKTHIGVHIFRMYVLVRFQWNFKFLIFAIRCWDVESWIIEALHMHNAVSVLLGASSEAPLSFFFPFCSAQGFGGGCSWCVALVVLVQLFTAEITLIVDTAARRSSYAVHVLIKKPRRHVVLVFPPPPLVCTWSGYNPANQCNWPSNFFTEK